MVELVAKLRNLGLLGTNLLYTTNGREYVTPEALQDEIITIVRKEQRVPLVRKGIRVYGGVVEWVDWLEYV